MHMAMSHMAAVGKLSTPVKKLIYCITVTWQPAIQNCKTLSHIIPVILLDEVKI